MRGTSQRIREVFFWEEEVSIGGSGPKFSSAGVSVYMLHSEVWKDVFFGYGVRCGVGGGVINYTDMSGMDSNHQHR